MSRLLVVGAAAALLLAPAAAAGLEVKSVDTGAHPTLIATVVASERSAKAPVVRENGERVADVVARNLADGKSLVLALDRSRSMRGAAFEDAVTALRRFVAAKPRSDRVAIHAFATQALELTRFSSATIDADIALREIAVDAVEGTALYDEVVLASRALASEHRGARVLVLLTDGNEVSSRTSLQGAIAAAREADVAVYPIAIESPQFTPGPLRTLAAETGGRYFGTESSASLADVYDSLAAELARTWRLEWVTGARRGESADLVFRLAGVGQTRTTVAVPGALRAEGASGLIPDYLYDSTAGTLVVAAVVGALVLLLIALLAASRRGSWLRHRLEPHVKTLPGEASAGEQQERMALASDLFRATERSLGHLRPWRALERLLERADIPLRTVQLLYICLGAAFLIGLVAAVAGLPALVILGGMALGAGAPILFVVMKARKRTKAFDDQLPDLLLTMAAALKAGHSFKQGINTLVEDGEPPASKEFKRVLTEMQLGRPMDEALADMSARLQSANFDFVITAVTIQRQVGGSLANLFDTVAQTVRDRQQFARKIRSLTAMGRGSAYVLVGLPFVLAGLLTLVNREFMTPLYTDPMGHMLIGIGLVSMTIGSLVLKKIVSFKG